MTDDPDIILNVAFFRTNAGAEPVRLKSATKASRPTIGEDIKTVQFGWPLGMPLVRKLDENLWEVRSRIPHGIARVMFTVVDKTMVLLHAFVKKSQKTPAAELQTARARLRQLRRR
jgi:phage-related protein